VFGDLRGDRTRAALALCGVALILVHGFAPKHFLVDYTSLGLLAFVLIILLLPRIKRLNIFGQEVTLAEKIEEVAEDAAELKEAAPPPTEEALVVEEAASSVTEPEESAMSTLAQLDPRASLSSARAEVSGRLLELFETIEPDAALPKNPNALIARLQARGYLDARQVTVAQRILALTEGGMGYESLTPAQAVYVAQSASDLVGSIRRTAPRVFDKEVAEEFQADPSLQVERNVVSAPPVRRRADFLVTADARRLVVDALFVSRPAINKNASNLVHEKSALERAFEVERVLVVIPDGIQFPARALAELSALAPRTRLLTLREFRGLTRSRNGLADA
jgi:hypothetical protein